MFSARVHGWWPWSDMTITVSDCVGALDERPQLAVEQAVDVAHPLGHGRRGGAGMVGMAGVHVLEQAVLDAVGRDEDDAGHVPGLAVACSRADGRRRGRR